MRIGSLFSGIGGFDLAAQWMGWSTKWYSEINPYACQVMEQHFGGAYAVGDITQWHPDPVGDAVDLVCGGFPCQPVSLAGKRQAQNDERWLWPEFARILGVLRPRYVAIENVPGLRSRGLGDVLRDLAQIGYDAEWTSLSAADVGAAHLRERVWVVAYPHSDGRLRIGGSLRAEQQGPPGDEPLGRHRPWGEQRDPGPVADAQERAQRAGLRPDGPPAEWRRRSGDGGGPVGDPDDAGRGEQRGAGAIQAEQLAAECRSGWATEPDVGRVAYGVPARVDRLRCLGNAIVPQCAQHIFAMIHAFEWGV